MKRHDALRQVFARRATARAKPAPVRIATALAGLVAAVASLPLVVVLPELGIPLLLLALRLLAIEFDWAAHAYAWVIWRWDQSKTWFHNASKPAQAATMLVLVALAVALVWLLIHEFA